MLNLEEELINLSSVPLGQVCTIEKIEFTDSKLQRYYDLGIARGTIIIPAFRSIFDDPTAYMVSGSIYAIRSADANRIKVNFKRVSEKC